MPTESSHYLFRKHPETCNPDDIWGQVKRTVGGKPVLPEQIEMIVTAIRDGLEIGPPDTLLDLCCGNGGLPSRLFEVCRGGLGVDYSEFLIRVAKRRFSTRPSERYLAADALEYLRRESEPDAFTKALCYGAFPYFGEEAASEMLAALRERFPGVTRVFLGQLPDKTRLRAFFTDRDPEPGEPENPGGLLGTPAEMAELAQKAKWRAESRNMPAEF
jgi:cyclopropane fatty-acyl-phospholipid synthase-like methyltransferase